MTSPDHRPGPPDLDPATLAVHAGREPLPGAPLSPPPSFASVYRAGSEHSYAREGSPTWDAFERAIAELERGREAVAFSSGMAAAAALLATLERGDKVVVDRASHVEVRRLLAEQAAGESLRIELADAADPVAFGAALHDARMAWVDSISNPNLEVAAIDEIAAASRAAGATLVVDATLATPILQRPLTLGADAVLHSASKYLGGHSDLLLGVIATSDPRLAAALRRRRETLGATPGTMEAWLALRGIRTLELRVRRGEASAGVLADRLASHTQVVDVRYPGLADGVNGRLLSGPGAMVSFTITGGSARADAVCEAVRVIVHAGSLGGVESLIERHAHWHDEPAVPPGLLRLSVGCEHVEDLWCDLARALEATTRVGRPRAVSRNGRPAAAT